MKNVLIFILLILTSRFLYGQKLSISIFETTKTTSIKKADNNLAEYKRITKENKAFLKEQKKRYKAYQDSVNRLSTDSLNLELSEDSLANLQLLQEQYFLYTNELYDYQTLSSWDSLEQHSKQKLLAYSEERLMGDYYYDKYMGFNNQILTYHKELKVYRDSLKTADTDKDKRDYLVILKKQELSKKYSKQVEQRLQKEIEDQGAIQFPTNNPELEKVLQYKDLAKGGFSPNVNQSKVKNVNYFEGKEELLAQAMDQSSELKEKYSKVINSNDLTTATKRNSLEGTKLGKRLVFGGTFQIHIDQQTSIDLNPELAYRINKKWDVGIGANYRVNSEIDELLTNIEKQSIFGYRVFTEYLLFKLFYGHVEWEALAAKQKTIADEASTKWNYSVLAGIERRFKLGDVTEAQISLLYNFMHKINPLYYNPWNVRFGFNFKEFGKKGG